MKEEQEQVSQLAQFCEFEFEHKRFDCFLEERRARRFFARPLMRSSTGDEWLTSVKNEGDRVWVGHEDNRVRVDPQESLIARPDVSG